MPLSLSNAAIQQFKNQFELTYQSENSLAGTTAELYGLIGDSYQLPYMGEGITTDRGAYQSLIAAQDLPISKKLITFSSFTSNYPLDLFQSKEVAGNTLGALSAVHSKAMSRRVCQVKINALAADPGETVAVNATNLTVDKLRDAKARLDNANVPLEGRVILTTPSQIDSLLSDSSVTSILFNQQRTLVSGAIDTFLGFKFLIPLGEMAEGGLPKAANIRSCFVWSKPAVTTGFSIAPSIDVQWSASHQSWLTISRLRLGAIVGQNKGVIEILCDETA